MMGIEAARNMREYEEQYNNVHTEILAVTMESLSRNYIIVYDLY